MYGVNAEYKVVTALGGKDPRVTPYSVCDGNIDTFRITPVMMSLNSFWVKDRN